MAHFSNPWENVDKYESRKLKGRIRVDKEVDPFDNLNFNFTLDKSYLSFTYNPYSKLIERTKYQVEKLEELQAFLHNVKRFIVDNDVKYFQCFVSAYKPIHQKMFYDARFKPRGYVPCWRYDEHSKKFEDYVLFNYFSGELSDNIKVIPESETLLKLLNVPEEDIEANFDEISFSLDRIF